MLLALAALAVLATRLPFLPHTLEDIDSVNFELGVHRFYPFGDQPHPPGYPVFIAAAKVVHPWFDSHAAGLAFPSALFSAIALVPLYVLFRHLVGRAPALGATALVLFNPIFWLNSVRPMSDLTGFTAALAAQCVLVVALAPDCAPHRQQLMWGFGVFLAALSVGVRLQAVVLVGPVLALGFFKCRYLRLPTAAVFTTTCMLWMVPTVAASGGVRRHFARQAQVFAEAWPSEPLVSGFSVERMYRGLGEVLVSPWGSTWLAGVVLFAAALGAIRLWREQRTILGIIALLFGPYALYHYALQATGALRYSIPLLPMVAVLASAALMRGRVLGILTTIAVLIVGSSQVTLPALQIYARGPSPSAEAIARLRQIVQTERNPVVAGNYVFDRYLTELASSARIIRTKPNQEWRALNRFWVDGDRRSIWFLRDPARSILRLKDPEAQTRIAFWEWPDPLMRLIRGARPTRIELVRIDSPRWFAESGFLLTSEAGPPDRVARERHLLFVRSDLASHQLVVSGMTTQEALVTVRVGTETHRPRQVDKHFSLGIPMPSDSTTDAYVPVHMDANAPLLLTSVTLDPGEDTVVAQSGFYETERDDLGQEFRWMGPTAEVAVWGSGVPLRVTVRGRVPDHYRVSLMLHVNVPGGPSRSYRLTEGDFQLTMDLPVVAAGSTATVMLSSSQAFVPHEVERNGDRRSLAVRIYELRAEPIDRRKADTSSGGA